MKNILADKPDCRGRIMAFLNAVLPVVFCILFICVSAEAQDSKSRKSSKKQFQKDSPTVVPLTEVPPTVVPLTTPTKDSPAVVPPTTPTFEAAPPTPTVLNTILTVGLTGPYHCQSLKKHADTLDQIGNTVLRRTGDEYCWAHYLGLYFKGPVDLCCSPNKAFSVQDQQAAGCTGSDSVDSCMRKLIDYCLLNSHILPDGAGIGESWSSKKNNYIELTQRLQECATKFNQMAQEAQKFLSLLP